MEWKSIFIGVAIGLLLMPTLFLIGLRLFLWLVTRKLQSMARKIEEQGGFSSQQSYGPGGFQVFTSMGAQVADINPRTPAEPLPALEHPKSLRERLEDSFLSRTSLTSDEWEQIRDRVVFVHDGLSNEELEELGFENLGQQGSPRQRAQGLATHLGSLQQPVEADVYVLEED